MSGFFGFTFDQDAVSRSRTSGHLDLKAAVRETTDVGEFSAIAAAWSLDRQNERIIKGAFAETIRRWKGAGKAVPLAWDHGRDLIGSIDPASMEERDDGLYVEGRLDLEDSELAREAWRSVKKSRVGLSFGFLITDERKAADGVREIVGIDLFEVTLTGSPVNADARILSAKSLTGSDFDGMSEAELKAYSQALLDDIGEKSHRPIQIASFEC